MKLTPILLTLFLIGLISEAAPGQSIGANLAGVVTDQTGARLQDATVIVTRARR